MIIFAHYHRICEKYVSGKALPQASLFKTERIAGYPAGKSIPI
ncbi:MAG: hypothetical protein WC176_08625 [Candidatus Cloacimonadaceae bacterium]